MPCTMDMGTRTHSFLRFGCCPRTSTALCFVRLMQAAARGGTGRGDAERRGLQAAALGLLAAAAAQADGQGLLPCSRLALSLEQ